MCAWVWYYYITVIAYDFIIKDFIIEKGCYLCHTSVYGLRSILVEEWLNKSKHMHILEYYAGI